MSKKIRALRGYERAIFFMTAVAVDFISIPLGFIPIIGGMFSVLLGFWMCRAWGVNLSDRLATMVFLSTLEIIIPLSPTWVVFVSALLWNNPRPIPEDAEEDSEEDV